MRLLKSAKCKSSKININKLDNVYIVKNVMKVGPVRVAVQWAGAVDFAINTPLTGQQQKDKILWKIGKK